MGFNDSDSVRKSYQVCNIHETYQRIVVSLKT